jgi:hypothetical protein
LKTFAVLHKVIAGMQKLIAPVSNIAARKPALFLEKRPNPDMAWMLHNTETQCD